ncbi:MAG: ABC transporter ATP-binding protein, partial [Candidatus Hecatellales archaeon]
MLRGEKVTKRFGGLTALKDIDFSVEKGSIFGLIGPNGSGKTTLFNVVCGVYKPEGGKIFFEGKEITGLPPHKICKLGIARTFQIVKPFANMKVID